MADLEAQLDGSARNPSRQSIDIPLQKLSELVEILTRSVNILQSSAASKDQTGPDDQPPPVYDDYSKKKKKGKRGEERNEVTETVDANTEHIGDQVKLSPDEIAHWNKALLEEFDSYTNPQDLTKNDAWIALQHLNWFMYASSWHQYSQFHPDVRNRPHCIPDIIRFFCENSDPRLEYQKKIYFGLSRWWWNTGNPSTQGRGILDMGPLISLIAMRVPAYWKVGDHVTGLALTRLQILIVLLDTPRLLIDSGKSLSDDERVVWEDELTFGMVLDECYKRGVLEAPGPQDTKAYKNHVKEVNHAIDYINLWEGRNYRDMHDITSVDGVRSMTLAESWLRYQNKRNVADSFDAYEEDEDEYLFSTAGEDDRFRSQDINLELLRKKANIRFEWTEYIDEHLNYTMGYGSGSSTVKLFWFGFAAKASPLFGVGCQTRSDTRGFGVIDELLATYSLLFRSCNDTYDDNLTEYGLLPIPHWLRVFHGTGKGTLSSQTAQDLSYFLQPNQSRVSDIECHIENLGEKLPPTQSFQEYAKWGAKLKVLKGCLDKQKDKESSRLWSRKRIRNWWAHVEFDAQWCTFWAIVVVGVVLIILASLGLVASIKGLDRNQRF